MYNCEICDKEFTSNKKLLSHLERCEKRTRGSVSEYRSEERSTRSRGYESASRQSSQLSTEVDNGKTLNEKIQKDAQTIQKLSKEVSDLKKTIQEDVEKKRVMAYQSKEQCILHAKEKQHLTTEMEKEKKSHIQKVTQIKTKYDNEVTKLKDNINDLIQKIKKLHNENLNLRTSAEMMETAHRTEMGTNKNILEGKDKQLKKLTNVLKSNNEKHALQLSKSEQQDEHIGKYKTQIKELHLSIQKLTNQIEERDAHIRAKVDQINKIKADFVVNLNKQTIETTVKIDTLTTENTALEERLKITSNEEKNLQEQLAHKSSLLGSYDKQITELKISFSQTLQQNKQKISEQESQITILTASIVESKKIKTSNEKSIQASQQQEEQLNNLRNTKILLGQSIQTQKQNHEEELRKLRSINQTLLANTKKHEDVQKQQEVEIHKIRQLLKNAELRPELRSTRR